MQKRAASTFSVEQAGHVAIRVSLGRRVCSLYRLRMHVTEAQADAGAPSGALAFLFTDIEGSTRLWERQPDAMRTALARHDAILRAAIEGVGRERRQDHR